MKSDFSRHVKKTWPYHKSFCHHSFLYNADFRLTNHYFDRLVCKYGRFWTSPYMNFSVTIFVALSFYLRACFDFDTDVEFFLILLICILILSVNNITVCLLCLFPFVNTMSIFCRVCMLFFNILIFFV